MLRFGPLGAEAVPTPAELRRLKEQYRRCGWVRLDGLLSPALLKLVRQRLRAAPFKAWTGGYSRRETPSKEYWSAFPGLFLAQPALFELVRALCGGKRSLRSLIGKTYRMRSGPEHHVGWHSDAQACKGLWFHPIAEASLLLNVGGRYSGGDTELRADDSERVRARLRVRRPGEAVLFRNTVLHRSAPVTGKTPKTVFVGLFSSKRYEGGRRGANPIGRLLSR